jgi:hypothetical protein
MWQSKSFSISCSLTRVSYFMLFKPILQICNVFMIIYIAIQKLKESYVKPLSLKCNIVPVLTLRQISDHGKTQSKWENLKRQPDGDRNDSNLITLQNKCMNNKIISSQCQERCILYINTLRNYFIYLPQCLCDLISLTIYSVLYETAVTQLQL